MKKGSGIFLVGLVLAGMGSIGTAGPSNMPARLPPEAPNASASAASYELDPAHTQVTFSVERFGFSRVIGFFDDISGELLLDPAHPERSSVHATIPIASLDTGNSERDGFLRGPFWLKGDQFSAIEFRSSAVRPTSATTAEVSGTLTLAGVSLPASMTVTLNRMGIDPHSKRPAAGFSATGTLSRSAFGIRTAPSIGDEVRFSIETFSMAKAQSALPTQ